MTDTNILKFDGGNATKSRISWDEMDRDLSSK